MSNAVTELPETAHAVIRRTGLDRNNFRLQRSWVVAVLLQRFDKVLNSVRRRGPGKVQIIVVCARYYHKLFLRRR